MSRPLKGTGKGFVSPPAGSVRVADIHNHLNLGEGSFVRKKGPFLLENFIYHEMNRNGRLFSLFYYLKYHLLHPLERERPLQNGTQGDRRRPSPAPAEVLPLVPFSCGPAPGSPPVFPVFHFGRRHRRRRFSFVIYEV